MPSSGEEISYLLDTNVLIWLDQQPERVPALAKVALAQSGSKLYVSAVSFWELAVKQGLGRFDKTMQIDRVLSTYNIAELAVTSRYTDTIRDLPQLHRDPFDRMLVAQAMVDGLVLVTADRKLAQYPVAVLQV